MLDHQPLFRRGAPDMRERWKSINYNMTQNFERPLVVTLRIYWISNSNNFCLSYLPQHRAPLVLSVLDFSSTCSKCANGWPHSQVKSCCWVSLLLSIFFRSPCMKGNETAWQGPTLTLAGLCKGLDNCLCWLLQTISILKTLLLTQLFQAQPVCRYGFCHQSVWLSGVLSIPPRSEIPNNHVHLCGMYFL